MSPGFASMRAARSFAARTSQAASILAGSDVSLSGGESSARSFCSSMYLVSRPLKSASVAASALTAGADGDGFCCVDGDGFCCAAPALENSKQYNMEIEMYLCCRMLLLPGHPKSTIRAVSEPRRSVCSRCDEKAA